MESNCCNCNRRIIIDYSPITGLLGQILCAINASSQGQDQIHTELRIIRQSVTSMLPFVAKVEYPTVVDDNRIVYTLQGSDQPFGITFRDYVLGPLDIYFSGKVPDMLPVYIKDASGFEHTVTAVDSDDPLIGVSDALVNRLLPATYEGNFIHLVS